MNSLQTKVTVTTTLVIALLLGTASVLIAVALREQAVHTTVTSSRIEHLCATSKVEEFAGGIQTISTVTCVEKANTQLLVKVPMVSHRDLLTVVTDVDYTATAVRPHLSLWPFTEPTTIPYTVVDGTGAPLTRQVSAKQEWQDSAAIAQQDLNDSLTTLYFCVLLLTTLMGVTVWSATGRVLRPVEAMRQEVAEITEHDLNRRVPIPQSDNEIARLAVTMNETLDRLHTAVEDTRRFVADASHELRSPLAALRAELEIAQSHPELADWPAVVDSALEDTQRLQELTTDLLLLARLDADAAARNDTVDLTAIVRRETARRRMADIQLHTEIDDEPALVHGRRAQLSRLLGNLLDNAERHAESTITVRLRNERTEAVMEVVDDGPGIPPRDRERIFDRFTRLDDARTRSTGGAGLGLAIARRIANRHQGTLQAADGDKYGGIRFVATIPSLPSGAATAKSAAVPAPRAGDEVWQFVNGSIVATHGYVEPRAATDEGLPYPLIFGEHLPVLVDA